MHDVPTLRSRPIQKADRAAIDALRERGRPLELPRRTPERLFEIDGRIVALSAAHTSMIAAPDFKPEPVDELERAFEPGPHLALIGAGLITTADLSERDALRVHRLARTLHSHELGARYCVISAPVQPLAPFSVAETVQQISAGGPEQTPITLPLAEGYWPIGTIGEEVVMILRNHAF